MPIGPWELVTLLIVALLVLGPDKLPQYAADAARFVRQLRRMAASAREEVSETLGPELRNLSLQDIEPRTFATRHLFDDDDDEDDRPLEKRPALRAGERPPYDSDAT